jgi:SAM-dependent methyltransferase
VVHSGLVLDRRMAVLAHSLRDLLPESGTVLDVGCGNGVISRRIMELNPRLAIEGIDVLARPECAIPMKLYDGESFPFNDKSLDVVMFVDVLHHTPDPVKLLREASRVARRSIVLKDHLCNGKIAWRILSFMDWVGNRAHGVVLPYNYFSSRQWAEAWQQIGSRPDVFHQHLGLYPWFARPVFENGLHFVARVPVKTAS